MTIGASVRRTNLTWLTQHGFRAADWLPLRRKTGQLRSKSELALRMLALDALFTWVSAPVARVSTERLRSHVQTKSLREHMTAAEVVMGSMERPVAKRRYRNTIGWNLEGVWPLAWMLGFASKPEPDGKPISNDITRQLLFDFLPKLDVPLKRYMTTLRVRPLDEIAALEDRYYCAHNATTSAMLGLKTIPVALDRNTVHGVISNRRRAFAWAFSPNTGWDDVVLNT